MNNSILYIIGNGFDLHHELKTRYSDFKKHLQKYNPNLEYLLETSFTVDLWSDFENNLATLDISEIFADNEDSLPDENSDRDGDKYILPDKMEQIREDLTIGLRNALRDWILELEYPSNVDDYLLNLDTNSIFLTFNYSDTLEQLYGIKPNNITYIHNKAKADKQSFRPDEQHYLDDDSDIIIGHAVENLGLKMPQINHKGFKTYYAYEEGFEALKSYNNFKNTKQVIADNKFFFENLSNIEKMIIIGHSLSDVDIPYFEEISKKAINVKEWKITYYGDNQLSMIQTLSAKFLKNNQNVEFMNTDDDIEILNKNLT